MAGPATRTRALGSGAKPDAARSPTSRRVQRTMNGTALAEQIETARNASTLAVCGRVTAVTGLTVQVAGMPVPVGSMCEIEVGPRTVSAEVIGFRGDRTLLMPLDHAGGLAKGQPVRFVTDTRRVAVGPGLLGRVVDGMGRTCDDGPPISSDEHYRIDVPAPNALKRRRIDVPLSVGVRSINTMLTVGAGGRLGLFAGTGVGKSVLLGMMARHTAADVSVIALVGERGREVGDFVSKVLGPQTMGHAVVVASTSDQSPALRLRAGFVATAIAEYFRDQGADVLLMMDSVTRLAMAGRQIGLAAGEPPATKGYTPSVFAMLPRLLERSGRTDRGSITGLYTVLVEGDDETDPIADAVRGILDGHIWLSRRIAARGRYPAVSMLDSISRLMPDVADAEQLAAARRVRRIIATWDEIEDLVNIGAYAAGSNPEFDLVIKMRPEVEAFLEQDMHEGVDMAASRSALLALAERIERQSEKLAKSANQES